MGKKKGYYLDKDGNIVDASESSGKKSKRKKKGCCYKTCCAAVITSLVLVVLVSAAGCYFGNKLLTENYDVTLAQVFGILGDVKNTNEKKIVKNKFSAKDFDSAEDSLKSAIFLKEDADFSLETLVDLALESALESDDSGARFMTALSDGENPENTETDNAIVEYIKSALVYENIDVEKLKGYDISKIDEYKLTLTDKELGGIIQRVFEKIMTSELVTKELETSLADMGLTAHDLALEKNFTLKQVIFDNADGESRVKATICFNLHKVITVITDKLDYQKLTGDANIAKYGKIGVKVVRPLIKALLPKKILLTADISLKEGGAPKFYLNNMSQKDMNIAYDLIDKISGTEGTSDSIKNSINEPFMEGGSIYNALKKVNEQVIDLNQAVGKGKLTLDVVQLGIDALKVNYEKNEQGEEVKKDPSECISSHDVYSGLSLVYGTSTDDVIGENGSKTAFDYNNIKILFDDEGKVMLDEDGLPKYEFVYQYDALLIEQGKNIIDDYEKAFLQEMSNCYGLKEGATFDEIIDVFSGLEGATSDVFGLFDTEKLKQIINSESRGGIISDTMLAAIVNEKIVDFLGDKAEFADMFSLKYLILSSKDEHTFAELGIYIEVAKLLGDNLDGEVAQIVTGILPKAFVISCKLDVTLGATEFADPEIRINDSAKTQDMVNLIDGLGLLGEGDDGQKIKIGAYLNDMLSPVRDTLHKMSDTLPGLALGTSKVMLPDIFDALAAFINSSNEGGNTISSTDLAQAMRVLTTDAPHNPLFDLTAADYENFGKSLLDEFNQTLALKKDDGKGNDYTLSDIMNNLGLGDGSVEAEQIINLIDSAKLEEIINASEIDRAFITDASGTSDMAVALIREVIGEYLTGDVAEFISAESILGIKIEEESGKTYLTVIVDVDISSLLGTDADEMMNFVMQLLPSKTVLTVKVDVTAGASEYAPTEIKYNFNDDSDKVMELIENFGVELPLGEVENSVRDAINEFTNNEMLGITLKNGGIELSSIFAIINNVALDTDMSELEIKDTLKVLITEAPTNAYTELGAEDFANYGKAVITELNDTMAIKTKDGANNPYTLGAIMDELGLGGEVNTDNIIDMIDSAKLEEIINASEIDRAFITDASGTSDMAVALIREVIGEYLTGDVAELVSADKVLGMRITESSGKTFLEMVILANVAAMIDSDDSAMNFVMQLLPSKTVLTVKVDVTAGASEYASTEIKYNFNDDSDKVMELIENFGVELPLGEVENSVRDAINEFTNNELLGITLKNGGIEMATVFTVINNVAFESDLTDEQIKGVMKAVYASSDAKIGTYFEDNEIQIVAPASNYSGFLSQVKEKYFIKSTLSTFDNVFDIVAAGGDTLHPDVFDLDALKHTPLTIDQLKPVMQYSEMGALMNEKLGATLSLSSLNLKQVGSDKYLQAYAKISLADYMGGENSFTDIITVSQLVVGIEINLSNVLTDADGKYYETTCTINNMSDTDMANLIAMLRSISPDFENEVYGASEDAGRQAYGAFSSLDENLGGNYSFNADGLKIGDVFSFIGREMLGETTDYDAQALKVKKALQGMFARETGSSEYNFETSNFVHNTPETTAPTLDLTLLKNGITDRQLGAYAEAKINEGGDEVGHVIQFSIIPSSRTTDKITTDINYINSFKNNTIGDGTYLIITDRIKLSKVATVADKFKDLLPEELYMTFVLKFDESDAKFNFVPYYRINEMDVEAEETLLSLIELTMQEMNDIVEENAGKCIQPVNDLFGDVEDMVDLPQGTYALNYNFTEITDATTARGKFTVGISIAI